MTQVVERKYHPLRGARGAYVVFQDDDGQWRWLWEEPNEPDEIGPGFGSRADALDGVAADWEAAGGEHLPRFVGMMRGLAKRARSSARRPMSAAHETIGS